MQDDVPAGAVSRFRPTTLRQFLIFHIAFRFDDLRNLSRYLDECVTPSKAQLLAAARHAEQEAFQNGSAMAQNFWEQLHGAGQEAP
jgi:hypothetical protein